VLRPPALQASPQLPSIGEPEPPAPIRPARQVDIKKGSAISQLEFDVAKDPGNSKLRRDLSILYLQAGRVAEAKEQARKAEELQGRRGPAPRR
jgi:hypothetical protein